MNMHTNNNDDGQEPAAGWVEEESLALSLPHDDDKKVANTDGKEATAGRTSVPSTDETTRTEDGSEDEGDEKEDGDDNFPELTCRRRPSDISNMPEPFPSLCTPYSSPPNDDRHDSVIRKSLIALDQDIRTNNDDDNFNNRRTSSTADLLTPGQKLATDESFRTRAIIVLFIAGFVDAANTMFLGPNYALMVTSGAHPDSFPSTAPFGTTTANFFIPMCANLGAATANIITPRLSDKMLGRRNFILINMFGSVLFTLGKYWTGKSNFWAFCAFCLINGFFSSTPALGLGYISDVYKDDRQKADATMGHAVAINVLGRTCGGFLPIFMPNHLFLPALPMAAITFVAAVIVYFFLPEPCSVAMGALTGDWNDSEEGVEFDEETALRSSLDTSNGGTHVESLSDDKIQGNDTAPDVLHQPTLWNVLFGAFADNVGSVGLIPLCLSPVLFQTFFVDFEERGETPIMSEQAYRYIYVFIAVSVVPAAVASPYLFKKWGPAFCCVVANIMTGVVQILLLYIAVAPETATTATFAIFVVILYIGFPITFISQLSTGPMLDRISPENKRGYVQGLNMASQDYATAIFPFLFGLLADNHGIVVCLWTATAASIAAALINSPLIFNPRLSPKAKKEDLLRGENDDIDTMLVNMIVDEAAVVDKLQRGSYVRTRDMMLVNMQRMDRGESFIPTPVGKYSRSDATICHDQRLREYTDLRDLTIKQLAVLNNNPDIQEAFATEMNTWGTNAKQTQQASHELGEWFGEYLIDNGYSIAEMAPILKQMIKTSFPRMVDGRNGGKVTSQNLESRLLRTIKLLNQYIDLESNQTDSGVSLLLGVGGVRGARRLGPSDRPSISARRPSRRTSRGNKSKGVGLSADC